ncbi:MAG: C-terminal target protein [Ignavibacteria bacterium]|nr:C-terminal target protein [Ignavibacteria bacterium]
MNRINQNGYLILLLSLIFNFFSIYPVLTQTYPTPYDLSVGNYLLTNWSNSAPAFTYPLNMMFHRTSSQDPTLTDETTGNYNNAYNLTSGTRINGMDNEGFSFQNTALQGNLGAAVLVLNSVNRQNIIITWTARTVSTGSRIYRIAIQYRVFGSDVWSNLNNVYESSAESGHSTTLNTVLPSDASNKSILQIRWKYYYVSGSGARPELGLDDIEVSSFGGIQPGPTKLAITKINPPNPCAGAKFDVTVESLDDDNVPQNVSNNTTFVFGSNDIAGGLQGNLSGTLLAGSNSTTITGISFTDVGLGVIISTNRISGDFLLSGNSNSFNVYDLLLSDGFEKNTIKWTKSLDAKGGLITCSTADASGRPGGKASIKSLEFGIDSLQRGKNFIHRISTLVRNSRALNISFNYFFEDTINTKIRILLNDFVIDSISSDITNKGIWLEKIINIEFFTQILDNYTISIEGTSSIDSNGKSSRVFIDNVIISGFETTLYPLPFSLAKRPYQFNNWKSIAVAGTYPANAMFFQSSSLTDPSKYDEPDGIWLCGYSYSSSARISGKDSLGLSFVSASNVQTSCDGAGFPVSANFCFNSINRTAIKVGWKGRTISSGGRKYGIALQYRTDTTLNFKSIGSEYISQTTGHYSDFDSFYLPSEADNKEYLELRWKYFYYGNGSGTRPELGIDNIVVSSDDPNEGLATKLSVSNLMPKKPSAGEAFAIEIRAIDNNGTICTLDSSIQITVKLLQGNGKLTGRLDGIFMKDSTVLILDSLIYDKNEQITLQVQQKDGTLLLPFDLNIEIVPRRIISLENFIAKIHCGKFEENQVMMPVFNIYIKDSTGNTIPGFDEEAVVDLLGDKNCLKGRKIVGFENGSAVFDSLYFILNGKYQMIITVGNTKFIRDVEVKPAPIVTPIIIPQYVLARDLFDASSNLLPSFALVEISNLHPSSNYRFITGCSDENYSITTSNGAGYNIHFNSEQKVFNFDTSKSLPGGNDSNYIYYSTFSTNSIETTKKLWINLVNSNNNAFFETLPIEWILSLGYSNGDLISRNRIIQQSNALAFGQASYEATGVFDEHSFIEPKHIVCLFADTIEGSMPLSTAITQDAGFKMSNDKNSIQGLKCKAPHYYCPIEGKGGSWATMKPNNEAIQKVVEYNLDGIKINSWNKSDGIWNSINTSRRGGLDAPIRLEIPAIKLDFPNHIDKYCNTNGKLMLRWQSHGINNLILKYRVEGTIDFEKINETIDAKAGYYDFDIPRNSIFSDKTLEFKLVSIEYPSITANSGTFIVNDSPKIEEISKIEPKCLNDSVTLFCRASGSKLRYSWLKNGIMTDFHTNFLNIKNLNYRDNGVYRLIVSSENECQPDTSIEFPLYVLPPPVFTKEPEDKNIFLDDKVNLSFEAQVSADSMYPDLDIQWYRGFNPLHDDSYICGSKSSILSISNLNPSDTIEPYYASINSKCGSAISKKVYLHEANFIILNNLPADTSICAGKDFESGFEIETNFSQEKPAYQWMRNSVDLSDGDKYSGTKTKLLKIKNTRTNDSGLYSCNISFNHTKFFVNPPEIRILIDSAPKILFQTPDKIIFAKSGEKVILFVSVKNLPDCKYQWYFLQNGNSLPIQNTGRDTLFLDNLDSSQSGSYFCVVENHCGTAVSDTFILNVGTVIITKVIENNLSNEFKFNIYPNPANDEIKLFIESGKLVKVELLIENVIGQRLAKIYENSSFAGKQELVINIEKLGLSDGMYLCRLVIGNKFIVKKFYRQNHR